MSLDALRAAIEPLRRTLLNHPIYQDLHAPAALRTFMEYHVFAVWDFMSLLKALQQHLCCVAVPWIPAASANAARLVNEIVLAEETDADGRGGFASHFELYHRAMTGFGARTSCIDRLLDRLRQGGAVRPALHIAEIPPAVCRFVEHTFDIIESDDPCVIASAFTFGREDLLPEVFQRIVRELNLAADGRLDLFEYYLHRHIELDSDEHGPMAARVLIDLCGEDPARWQRAQSAAIDSLQARVAPWNAIHESIGASPH